MVIFIWKNVIYLHLKKIKKKIILFICESIKSIFLCKTEVNKNKYNINVLQNFYSFDKSSKRFDIFNSIKKFEKKI